MLLFPPRSILRFTSEFAAEVGVVGFVEGISIEGARPFNFPCLPTVCPPFLPLDSHGGSIGRVRVENEPEKEPLVFMAFSAIAPVFACLLVNDATHN